MPDRTACSFRVPGALEPDPQSKKFVYRHFIFDSSQRGTTYTITVKCDGEALGTFELSKGGGNVSVPGASTDRHAVGTLSLVWDTGHTAALIVFDGTLYGCVAVGLIGVIVASFD